MAISSSRGKLPFHNHLRGDARMVCAYLPQGLAPLHAVKSNQRIHDGVLKPVTHMQAARHIGWRDNYAVGGSFTLG